VPYLSHDGADLHYEVTGSGDPILLIQGLGYSGDAWWRVVPWLSERFTVVRLDNRGVGRTGPAAPGPYTTEQMAADALAVLTASGFAHAHVWGVSMGGTIAQEIALRSPDRVDRLILGCTHPGGADFVINPEALALLTSRGEMSPREAAEAAIPFVYAESTPREDIERDIEARMAVPTTPEGYAAQLEGVRTWAGSGHRLGAITAPTLVIHGADDRLVPAANGRFLAARIPGATLVELEGASHIFWTDRPDAVREAVLGFLAAG